MVNHACARQNATDHLAAKPGAQIVRIISRDDGNLRRRHRSQAFRGRNPHQHLRCIDRSGALDAERVAIEEQRQIAQAHMVGKTERGTVAVLRKIRRAVAQNEIALAEAQMREQAFHVRDALQHAEHHNNVGPGRGLGREFVGVQIDHTRTAFLSGRAADIVAAGRQQSPQGRVSAEIEHACTGRDELGRELGERIRYHLRDR